MNDYLHK
ncbi:hypothetical protein SOVF_064110, partial [Spinacia oleracea]